MSEIPRPLGTLFIDRSVLLLDKWLTDQAIAAADIQMKKYKYLDGFLKPSPIRRGDFSFVLADHKVTPIVASFIGIPGIGKAAIIQELFVAS
ncbi:hypothetical protein ES703_107806 [subsurface metagenome]